MIKSDGFVYLKVDDHYIHTLFPLLGLKHEGYREPPYFRSKEAPGAHISVFYADEHVIPSEIGDEFQFKPERIKITKTRDASYVVLQVESRTRKAPGKYGLSPRLKNHPFHITLAKKNIKLF